ncbi:MAG: hypothetical protein E7445_03625 [Ruminococcaceae bacterium]|nr:hypothetical protein [Oscillospiraceae bacterium]
MQLYLAVTPTEEQEVCRRTRRLAHVAYRIGKGMLLRQELSASIRGGLLSLSDQDAPFIPNPEQLVTAILRECAQRGYSGVVADFELPPTKDRIALLRALANRSSKSFQLLVPEGWSIPGASVLINTAVSGGNLTQYLQEAIRRYPGASLDLQRLMMDFTLPAPSGEGKPLSLDELTSLRKRLGPSVFFSPELCSRYFTYMQGSQAHFVLYDDAETMQQKMKLAQTMGYRTALVMYPEVSDLIGQLFSA